jgi:hypothetical protein
MAPSSSDSLGWGDRLLDATERAECLVHAEVMARKPGRGGMIGMNRGGKKMKATRLSSGGTACHAGSRRRQRNHGNA